MRPSQTIRRMKIVYSYHPVTGVYTGTTEADESPLEPGVFHVPAFATELEPPQPRKGCEIVWSGTEWRSRRLPPPPKQKEPAPAELAADARARRNALLTGSDWTQLADVPAWVRMNLERWRTYRQALRDVPQQPGFPAAIEWPEVPQ